MKFVVRGAKACGCLKAPEPAHQIGALFNALVSSLTVIIDIINIAVDDLRAERAADRAGVRIIGVGIF